MRHNPEQIENDWNDDFCSVCKDGGQMICCDGTCLRAFHPACLHRSELPPPGSGDDDLWFCKMCRTGWAQCAECNELGKAEDDLFKCTLPSCGRSYHLHCLAKWGTSVRWRRAGPRGHGTSSAGGALAVESIPSFECPSHICLACESKQGTVLRCIGCPTGLHGSCLPDGISTDVHEHFVCEGCARRVGSFDPDQQRRNGFMTPAAAVERAARARAARPRNEVPDPGDALQDQAISMIFNAVRDAVAAGPSQQPSEEPQGALEASPWRSSAGVVVAGRPTCLPPDVLAALPKEGFVEVVSALHATLGRTFRPPVFAGQPLDIYKVFVEVQSRGGYQGCCANKEWSSICRSLDVELSEGMTSMGHDMKIKYERTLLEYEDFVCRSYMSQQAAPAGSAQPGASAGGVGRDLTEEMSRAGSLTSTAAPEGDGEASTGGSGSIRSSAEHVSEPGGSHRGAQAMPPSASAAGTPAVPPSTAPPSSGIQAPTAGAPSAPSTAPPSSGIQAPPTGAPAAAPAAEPSCALPPGASAAAPAAPSPLSALQPAAAPASWTTEPVPGPPAAPSAAASASEGTQPSAAAAAVPGPPSTSAVPPGAASTAGMQTAPSATGAGLHAAPLPLPAAPAAGPPALPQPPALPASAPASAMRLSAATAGAPIAASTSAAASGVAATSSFGPPRPAPAAAAAAAAAAGAPALPSTAASSSTRPPSGPPSAAPLASSTLLPGAGVPAAPSLPTAASEAGPCLYTQPPAPLAAASTSGAQPPAAATAATLPAALFPPTAPPAAAPASATHPPPPPPPPPPTAVGVPAAPPSASASQTAASSSGMQPPPHPPAAAAVPIAPSTAAPASGTQPPSAGAPAAPSTTSTIPSSGTQPPSTGAPAAPSTTSTIPSSGMQPPSTGAPAAPSTTSTVPSSGMQPPPSVAGPSAAPARAPVLGSHQPPVGSAAVQPSSAATPTTRPAPCTQLLPSGAHPSVPSSSAPSLPVASASGITYPPPAATVASGMQPPSAIAGTSAAPSYLTAATPVSGPSSAAEPPRAPQAAASCTRPPPAAAGEPLSARQPPSEVPLATPPASGTQPPPGHTVAGDPAAALPAAPASGTQASAESGALATPPPSSTNPPPAAIPAPSTQPLAVAAAGAPGAPAAPAAAANPLPVQTPQGGTAEPALAVARPRRWRGVELLEGPGLWLTHVQVKGQKRLIGAFRSEAAAARAFDLAMLELYPGLLSGGLLNYPLSEYHDRSNGWMVSYRAAARTQQSQSSQRLQRPEAAGTPPPLQQQQQASAPQQRQPQTPQPLESQTATPQQQQQLRNGASMQNGNHGEGDQSRRPQGTQQAPQQGPVGSQPVQVSSSQGPQVPQRVRMPKSQEMQQELLAELEQQKRREPSGPSEAARPGAPGFSGPSSSGAAAVAAETQLGGSSSNTGGTGSTHLAASTDSNGAMLPQGTPLPASSSKVPQGASPAGPRGLYAAASSRPPALPKHVLDRLPREGFVEAVTALHASLKRTFKVPIFAGQPLDIYKVFVEVQSRGGYHTCCENKEWIRICKSLDPNIKMTSMSSNIKVNYERCLLEYEDFMCRSYHSKAAAGGSLAPPNPVAVALQLTPTPWTSVPPKPEAAAQAQAVAPPATAVVTTIPVFPTVTAAAAAGRAQQHPCSSASASEASRPSGPAGASCTLQPTATDTALTPASRSAPDAALATARPPSAAALPPLSSSGAPLTHPTGPVTGLSAFPVASSAPPAPPLPFSAPTATAATGSTGSKAPASSSSAAVAQGSLSIRAPSGVHVTSPAGLSAAAQGGKASLNGTLETNAVGSSVPSHQPPGHSLPSATKPPPPSAAAAAVPSAAGIEERKPPPRLSPEPDSSDNSIQAFRTREKNRVRLYRYNVYLEARMKAIKALQERTQLEQQLHEQQHGQQRRASDESRGGSSRSGPRDHVPIAPPEAAKEAESTRGSGGGSKAPFQPCVLERMAEAHRKLRQQRPQGPPWLVPGGSVPVPGITVIPVGTQGELPQKRKRSSEASGRGKSKAGPRAPSVWSFPDSVKRRMTPPTWEGPSWAPEPAGSPKPWAPPPQQQRQQTPKPKPPSQQEQKSSRKRERSPTTAMTTRQSDGSSGGAFRGVTFSRRMKKWRAQVRCNNDLQPLGVFPTAEDAARAYDVRAMQLWGSRAQLNFPRSNYQAPSPPPAVPKPRSNPRPPAAVAPPQVPTGLERRSAYIGVSWDSRASTWTAVAVGQRRKKTNLGSFVTEEDAARAYDRHVLTEQGPQAITNFPAADYDIDYGE